MSRIFGQINQIGYVVHDLQASMEHWVAQGVGPWFYMDPVVTDYFRYRGADSGMKMAAAVANSGDIQIELIQPLNDEPSLYKDFLDVGREGAQHVAYWTADYQGDRDFRHRRCEGRGVRRPARPRRRLGRQRSDPQVRLTGPSRRSAPWSTPTCRPCRRSCRKP